VTIPCCVVAFRRICVVTPHWGIPVTTAARTLADLAHVLTPAALTRAVNDARLRSVLNLDDLPPRLRADQSPRPTRSAFEDAFLRFVRRYADLLTAGHRVIRVTYERLAERPAAEAKRFRALLA
jgi:hypothetical protein